MVIDLETAAKADQVLPSNFRLLDWSDNTLDKDTLDKKSRFTKESDMHQIGVALLSCNIAGLSEEAKNFIDMLKCKRLDAAGALQHVWLQHRLPAS